MRTKKSGYYILKEKVAKLEKERDELQKDLDFALEKAKKERDEWKAKFEEQKKLFDKLYKSAREQQDHRAFLLDHCPFWVRWLYRKQFEKGGKE